MANKNSKNAIWVLTLSWIVIAASTTYAQTTVEGVSSGEQPIRMRPARRRYHAAVTAVTPSTEGTAVAPSTINIINPLLLCPSTLLCRGVCREACNLNVIAQQLAIAAKGTEPGVDIVTAAAKMFTPNAYFVATPIAAFANGLVAFEYFLTFSRQPGLNVPPPVVTLRGVQVQDIIVSGNTVTNVYDLLLASPFNATKTATLRGWSMAAFNEVSKITYQTLIYPLWEEVVRTLGLVEAFSDPTTVATVADLVCTAHQAFCTGDNEQYDSKNACMDFMTALPPPPVHRLAGNNLFCRLFHARYVDLFAAEHCPHIGRTGGGQCTEELPFTMAKINANLPRAAFYSVNPLLQPEINKTAGF